MKVAAVAHDPGGANAVAAVVAALRADGVDVVAHAKGPAERQFEQMRVGFEPVPADHAQAIASISGGGADLLLAGTSARATFELDAVAACSARGIPTLAVMDYWANYRARFEREGTGLYLPDVITAIDPAAAAAMAADGLPKERILITGQPYLAWLLDWDGKSRATRPLRPLERPVQSVLFASQPDANEIEALGCVAEAVAARGAGARLTIRFHPRQTDRAPSLARARAAGADVTVDEGTDTRSCLAGQDVVFGISSTFLVEAALLGIPTAGVLLGVEDPLAPVRPGLMAALRSAPEVHEFLRAPVAPQPNSGFALQQQGADLRVAALCRNLGFLARQQTRPA